MREDPMSELLHGPGGTDDNVIAMPDLLQGRLADLIAAAGGPPQDHELKGELAARTAFRSAAQSWPSSRRRLRMRRGPAVVAATTMATMLVATTGFAAASVLPGSAGRAVDGFLGSVGVDIAPSSTPAAPSAPGTTGSETVSAPALTRVGTVHVGCTIGGGTPSGSAAGTVESSSCALTAPLPPKTRATTNAVPAVTHRSAPVAPKAAPVAQHSGPASHPVHSGTPSTPPTTLPGGGTSRGGNQGAGGGNCKGGSSGSTTTTTTSSDPTTTTTTTDPTTVGSGCGHGGHHHGASSGQSTSTGGTGSSTS
jgi:hypothetical protein